MKKSIFAVVLFSLLSAISYADDYSHWSLSLGAGTHYLDGDFEDFSSNKFRPSFSGTLNYDFTPVLGIQLMYTYATMQMEDSKARMNSGIVHNPELGLTIDFIDAWLPYRQRHLFSLYGIAGVGYGLYNVDMTDKDHSYCRSTNGKFEGTTYFTLGLDAEWRITRWSALGLRTDVRFYHTDFLDGRPGKSGAAGYDGTKNDVMIYAQAYYRLCINDNKDKEHIRGVGKKILEPFPIQRDTLYIIQRDTVYSRDTIVEMHRDTIYSVAAAATVVPVVKTEEVVMQGKDDRKLMEGVPYFVTYYANDSYAISSKSVATLNDVIRYCRKNPKAKIELRSFCDATASPAYNQRLSIKRSNAVAAWLKKKGLGKRIILIEGKGIDYEHEGAWDQGRRTEIKIVMK
ncbi:MAG: OmpA family protein [Paludibacteraceae bacterium]|nr:OmpA family protein [Paludibacteraceae bacterium]